MLNIKNYFENIPKKLCNIQINACRYHIRFCENEAHKIFHIKCSLDFVPEGFVQFPKLPKLGLQIPEFRIMYLKCLHEAHTRYLSKEFGFYALMIMTFAPEDDCHDHHIHHIQCFRCCYLNR